jgi:ubiquinone/menaquinone biosynthesis C-methylase UbiE
MKDAFPRSADDADTSDGQVDHAAIRDIFRRTPGSYSRVLRITTLGMDLWWKRRMFSLIPTDRTYRRILDLGSGTGIVTLRLARQFPDSEIIGIDLTPENVEYSRARAMKAGLDNVRFLCMPIEELSELQGTFDLVTGSFIPKLIDVQVLAADLAAKVNPGGVIVIHDFTLPENRLLLHGFNWYWCISSRIMSLSPAWKPTADYLGTIIRQTTWVPDLDEALTASGFTVISRESQPLQIAAIISAER